MKISLPFQKNKFPPISQGRSLTRLIRCGLRISVVFTLIWTHANSAKPPLPSPSITLKAFDSLLEVGNFPAAKLLCTGQVLRMFDFISMAQANLAGAIDTSLSKDSTLEEKIFAPWAYVKMTSHAVFTKPMFGQSEITSTQVIHLYHAPQRGWLIAEMEELASATAPVHFRNGNPMDTSQSIRNSPQNSPTPSAASLGAQFFPVSPKAPAQSVEVDRIQYRLRLKNGSSLADICILGLDQYLVRKESPSEWILENKLLTKPSVFSPPPPLQKLLPNIWPDSLKSTLSSNHYLKLEDLELRKTAELITKAETNPVIMTQLIFNWVTANFKFELGAVLFASSSEVLKDLTGDCSEAAILTTALLRSKGIPARVALGFASLGQGVFIGHAWSEAYLNGAWIGIDAALRQYPSGVERVKLKLLDGKEDMRIVATNLMISVLSNLEIEILAAWKNNKLLPLQTFPNNSAQAENFFKEVLKGINAPVKRAQ